MSNYQLSALQKPDTCLASGERYEPVERVATAAVKLCPCRQPAQVTREKVEYLWVGRVSTKTISECVDVRNEENSYQKRFIRRVIAASTAVDCVSLAVTQKFASTQHSFRINRMQKPLLAPISARTVLPIREKPQKRVMQLASISCSKDKFQRFTLLCAYSYAQKPTITAESYYRERLILDRLPKAERLTGPVKVSKMTEFEGEKALPIAVFTLSPAEYPRIPAETDDILLSLQRKTLSFLFLSFKRRLGHTINEFHINLPSKPAPPSLKQPKRKALRSARPPNIHLNTPMRTIRSAFDDLMKDPVKILRKALTNATKRQISAITLGFLRWKKGGMGGADRQIVLWKGLLVLRGLGTQGKKWAFLKLRGPAQPKPMSFTTVPVEIKRFETTPKESTAPSVLDCQEYTPLTVAQDPASETVALPIILRRPIQQPITMKHFTPVERLLSTIESATTPYSDIGEQAISTHTTDQQDRIDKEKVGRSLAISLRIGKGAMRRAVMKAFYKWGKPGYGKPGYSRNPRFIVSVLGRITKKNLISAWLRFQSILTSNKYSIKPITKPSIPLTSATSSTTLAPQSLPSSHLLHYSSNSLVPKAPSFPVLVTSLQSRAVPAAQAEIHSSDAKRRNRLLRYIQVCFLNGLRRHLHTWRVSIRSVEYMEEVVEVTETTHVTVTKVRESATSILPGGGKRTILKALRPHLSAVYQAWNLAPTAFADLAPLVMSKYECEERVRVGPRSNAKEVYQLRKSFLSLNSAAKMALRPAFYAWKHSDSFLHESSERLIPEISPTPQSLNSVLRRANAKWEALLLQSVQDWHFLANLRMTLPQGTMPFSVVASPESMKSLGSQSDITTSPKKRQMSIREGRNAVKTLISTLENLRIRPAFEALKPQLPQAVPRTSLSTTIGYPLRVLLLRYAYQPAFSRLKQVTKRTPSISFSKESSISIYGSEVMYEEVVEETVVEEVKKEETVRKVQVAAAHAQKPVLEGKSAVRVDRNPSVKPIIEPVKQPLSRDYGEFIEETPTLPWQSKYSHQAANGLYMLLTSLVAERCYNPVLTSLQGPQTLLKATNLQKVLLTLVSAYDFMPIFLILQQSVKSRRHRKQKDLHPSVLRKQTNLRLVRFANILKLAISRRKKWALSRTSGYLPKYLKRRYYAIQKSIKAISHIMMGNTCGAVFELMKFLMYYKDRPTASESMSLIPLGYYTQSKIRLLQRYIRGFLARRRRDKLRIEKIQRDRLALLVNILTPHISVIKRIQRKFKAYYQLRKVTIVRKTVHKTSLKSHPSTKLRESLSRSQLTPQRPSHRPTPKPGVTFIEPKSRRKEAVTALVSALKRWVLRMRKSRVAWAMMRLGCKRLRSKVMYQIQKGSKGLKDVFKTWAFEQMKRGR